MKNIDKLDLFTAPEFRKNTSELYEIFLRREKLTLSRSI